MDGQSLTGTDVDRVNGGVATKRFAVKDAAGCVVAVVEVDVVMANAGDLGFELKTLLVLTHKDNIVGEYNTQSKC